MSGRLLPKGIQEGTESARKTTMEEVEDKEGFVLVSREEWEEWEMVGGYVGGGDFGSASYARAAGRYASR